MNFHKSAIGCAFSLKVSATPKCPNQWNKKKTCNRLRISLRITLCDYVKFLSSLSLRRSCLRGKKKNGIWSLVQRQLREQSHHIYIQGKSDWNRKRQGALWWEEKLGEDKVELAGPERCHLNLEGDKKVGEEMRSMVWVLFVLHHLLQWNLVAKCMRIHLSHPHKE